MLTAICLNDQPCFQARKVSDVVIDRHLPAESKSADLPLPQETPQGTLRVCHVLAEIASVSVRHRCGGSPPSSFG